MRAADSRAGAAAAVAILQPMRRIAPLLRLLLSAVALAAASGTAAQSQPPAADAPAAPPPAPGPAAGADLAALGAALSAERRVLKADGVEFAVFVRPALGPDAQGTLLLIPGDGSHPTSAAGLEQIRQTMPALGWATWLLTLEPPPRVQSGKLHAAAQAAAPPADVAPAGAAPAAGESEAGLDARRAQALEQWVTRCQARLIAATAAAAADGRPLVLVAEGSAAAVLTRGMASAPGAVRAAALLEPVELPGLAPEWPRGLERPVLEVLDPAASREQGRLRREQALARQLQDYRQLTLETAGWSPDSGERALTRHLRGWLTALLRAPDAAPGGG